MALVVALILIAVVAFQWFTQQVTLRFGWFWQLTFHRDEWPAFFWIVMGLETGVALFCVYGFFAWK